MTMSDIFAQQMHDEVTVIQAVHNVVDDAVQQAKVQADAAA